MDYKYGKPENRPANIRNPKNYGSLCFDGDTLVATSNGFKPIKDIQIGDMVFTHLGNLKPVTDKMSRVADNIIRVSCGTQNIVCTDNHPFLSCNGGGRDFKFMEIKDIYNKSYRGVVQPILNLESSVEIDEDLAFILGFYMANGTCGYRSDCEEDTLTSGLRLCVDNSYKDIYDELFTNMGVDYSYHTGTGNSATYYIKNNDIRDFCVKYGGFNYKDEQHKVFSPEILNWCYAAKLALIKGFFAGDGQYGSTKKHLNMRFLNTNVSYIDGLHLLLRSLGIHSKICRFSRKPRKVANNPEVSFAKDMYCITISGIDVTKIDGLWLHSVKHKMSGNYSPSTYKSRVFNSEHVEYFYANVKNMEILPPQEVYNISVADDDSYLVTYDMFAVHNCKHLISLLSNKKWLQQVTGTLMDFIEKNIDKVNTFLKVKPGEELTLPNQLARQNAKAGFYSKLFKDTDDENVNSETTSETADDSVTENDETE